MRRLRIWLPWVGGVLLISGVIAALDGQAKMLSGWLAYFVLCALSVVMICLTWKWVTAGDGPRWLVVVLGVALTLRLGVGIALTYALPRFGYDEDPQRAGYVFRDAFTRDGEAWSLATSDKMLLSAFSERSESDQYGGLLYVSALIYRTLSPDVHCPLLIVVMTAVISSLAVLFTWGFATLTFGPEVATFATWAVTLYPDAILLGASQMREPFLGTALAASLYGYGVMRKGELSKGILTAIFCILLLALPMSPPYAVVFVIVVGVAWLWEGRISIRRSSWILIPILSLVLVAVVLAGLAWSRIEELSESGLVVLLNWWEAAGGQWQRNIMAMQSDVIKGVFQITPEWAHLPLVVAYGLVRPFLPAALHDRGIPIWYAIVIWRSLGWFTLLSFLLYAPLAAFRSKGLRSLPSYLSFLVWGTAVAVSYRGGGDMWDNPRYRVVFLTAQAVLAGWAWIHTRRSGSSWLRRIWLLMGFTTLSFLVWYRGRAGWPTVHSLWITIFVTGALVLLYVGGTALFDALRRRRESDLTNSPPEL